MNADTVNKHFILRSRKKFNLTKCGRVFGGDGRKSLPGPGHTADANRLGLTAQWPGPKPSRPNCGPLYMYVCTDIGKWFISVASNCWD
jgi:hypothetical protein